MSSQQRSSSSGVRDLRAMFEKKDGSSTDLHAGTESPDRGRSPSSISARGDSVDKSPAGAARKIRSSFVNVDAPSSAANMANARRESVSLDQEKDKEALSELKKTVSNEYERRKSVQMPETVPEQATTSALPTPAIEEGNKLGDSTKKAMPVPPKQKQSEHPEKTVSAIEDPGKLRAADVKETANVSRSKPGAPKTSRPSMNGASKAHKPDSKPAPKTKTTVPKPPNLSTSIRAPQSSSVKSPTLAKDSSKSSRLSQSPRTSTNHNTPPHKAAPARPKSPTRPVPLPSHLTAPTAASAAKHEPEPKKETNHAAFPGLKSPTRPVPLPSHLTAPTAASAAKHEPESKKDTSHTAARKTPVELPSRLTAPTASSKAKHEDTEPPKKPSRTSMAPRTSLSSAGSSGAAPKPKSASRHSIAPGGEPAPSTRKKTTAPSEGFLARMMKPTASSINKHQDEKDASRDEKSARRSSKEGPAKEAASSTVNAVKKITKPATGAAKPGPTKSSASKPEPTKTPEKQSEDPASAEVAAASQAGSRTDSAPKQELNKHPEKGQTGPASSKAAAASQGELETESVSKPLGPSAEPEPNVTQTASIREEDSPNYMMTKEPTATSIPAQTQKNPAPVTDSKQEPAKPSVASTAPGMKETAKPPQASEKTSEPANTGIAAPIPTNGTKAVEQAGPAATAPSAKPEATADAAQKITEPLVPMRDSKKTGISPEIDGVKDSENKKQEQPATPVGPEKKGEMDLLDLGVDDTTHETAPAATTSKPDDSGNTGVPDVSKMAETPQFGGGAEIH